MGTYEGNKKVEKNIIKLINPYYYQISAYNFFTCDYHDCKISMLIWFFKS
jgi:hypothetical protein